MKSFALRKRACTVIAVLVLAASMAKAQDAPRPPQHPITLEQVKQLLAMTHTPEHVRAGIHQMIEAQKKAVPYFPEGFWNDFEAEIDKLDWVPIAVPVYQKYISEEDAAKAIEFYSTPAGQRILSTSGVMMQELMASGQQVGEKIGARLGEKYRKEIEDGMRKMQQGAAASSSR